MAMSKAHMCLLLACGLAQAVGTLTRKPMDSCDKQNECLDWSIEEGPTDTCDGVAGGGGECFYKVCVETDWSLPGCDKDGTFSHSCKKDDTACPAEDGFDGDNSDLVTGQGDGHKQCQWGAGGDTLEFLFKDGSGCSGGASTWDPDVNAECKPSDAPTCTGNAAGVECIWTVTVPPCPAPGGNGGWGIDPITPARPPLGLFTTTRSAVPIMPTRPPFGLLFTTSSAVPIMPTRPPVGQLTTTSSVEGSTPTPPPVGQTTTTGGVQSSTAPTPTPPPVGQITTTSSVEGSTPTPPPVGQTTTTGGVQSSTAPTPTPPPVGLTTTTGSVTGSTSRGPSGLNCISRCDMDKPTCDLEPGRWSPRSLLFDHPKAQPDAPTCLEALFCELAEQERGDYGSNNLDSALPNGKTWCQVAYEVVTEKCPQCVGCTPPKDPLPCVKPVLPALPTKPGLTRLWDAATAGLKSGRLLAPLAMSSIIALLLAVVATAALVLRRASPRGGVASGREGASEVQLLGGGGAGFPAAEEVL